MPAARKDLTADVGATFRWSFTYTDSDGAPINLTGYTSTMVITTPKGAAIATLTPVLGGVAGTVTVTATDEVTALWADGKQSYRLDITSGSGEVDRIYFGAFKIRPQVFQPA